VAPCTNLPLRHNDAPHRRVWSARGQCLPALHYRLTHPFLVFDRVDSHWGLLEQDNDFPDARNIIGNRGFHRWRHAEGLMHSRETVVHEVQRDSRRCGARPARSLARTAPPRYRPLVVRSSHRSSQAHAAVTGCMRSSRPHPSRLARLTPNGSTGLSLAPGARLRQVRCVEGGAAQFHRVRVEPAPGVR
jgi:hypothetical protein